MRREVVLATLPGGLATIALAILIVLGSPRFSHFDAAFVGYTLARLFAVFGNQVPLRNLASTATTWLY
jgi:hypothetical protein